ncbi:MAG: hypothetical protein WD534_14225 [Phycisphaeraceae bacterium]
MSGCISDLGPQWVRLLLPDPQHLQTSPLRVHALRPDGQDDPDLPPIDLPPLPTTLLDRYLGVMRAAWERQRRCLLVLLYLDMGTGSWQEVVSSSMATNRAPGAGWSPIRSRNCRRVAACGAVQRWPANNGFREHYL